MIGESAPEIILKRIRNCYRTIHVLTVECISENSAGALPELIGNREELMNIIAAEERNLVLQSASANECLLVRDEIASIVTSIRLLDSQLEILFKNSLNEIRRELSSLYSGAKAATAYTAQVRG